MPSEFTDETSMVTGSVTDPSPPKFISAERAGNGARLVYELPTTFTFGDPLVDGAFSSLQVCADTRSFLGRIEELMGMEPKVTVPVTVAQAGQQITVEVPNLTSGTKYFFKARMV